MEGNANQICQYTVALNSNLQEMTRFSKNLQNLMGAAATDVDNGR